MLGKLLKYEFKATGRLFLPLYGALLILAALNNLLSELLTRGMPELPVTILMGVFVILVIGIFVLTMIVMIQRFYKNLLSDEGYLMFTLPVKTWQLTVSKLVVSMVWVIASTLITILGMFIMVLDTGLIAEIPYGVATFFRYLRTMGISESVFVIETVLTLFLEIISSILMIYAAIAIGHLFHKHRVLAAFGAFIGINVALQLITSFVFSLLTFSGFSVYDNYTLPEAFSLLFHFIMVPALLISIISCVALFLLTNFILSRKLNLE